MQRHNGAHLSLTMIRWLLWRATPSLSGLVILAGQWLMGRAGAAESAVGHCHHPCCKWCNERPWSILEVCAMTWPIC